MRALLPMAVLLLSTACGKIAPPPEKSAVPITAVTVETVEASCDLTAEQGTCSDYGPRERSSFGRERSACESANGKFTEGARCAIVDQEGWCTLTGGEVKRYKVAVGLLGAGAPPPPGFTSDDAKADCEGVLHGTYTADPATASRPRGEARLVRPSSGAPSGVSSAFGAEWGTGVKGVAPAPRKKK